MKVLIVDDSLVFRSQIKVALEGEPDLEIVGVASNGKIALDKMKQTPVDLVTLDLEMPVLSGIETLKEMKAQGINARVIVFSSISTQGSKVTLEALSSGAHDFVTKPSGDGVNINNAAEKIREQLLPKVRQFIGRGPVAKAPPVASDQPAVDLVPKVTKREFPKKNLATFRPSVVLIGSSTGGPPALETIFKGISGPTRCPILIAQHMPPVFTTSLARRIEEICGIPCAEPKNGEVIEAGKIYLAPGDFHFSVKKANDQVIAVLDQNPPVNYVRPAVDVLFESAARLYREGCAAFVLTGMGADGQKGCVTVKESGGGVMIQNEKSCVVYGMPAAVHEAGAFDREADLAAIEHQLKEFVCDGAARRVG